MTTATLLRRQTNQRTLATWTSSVLSAFSAKIEEIFSRKGSTEPKREFWRYFSA